MNILIQNKSAFSKLNVIILIDKAEIYTCANILLIIAMFIIDRLFFDSCATEQ